MYTYTDIRNRKTCTSCGAYLDPQESCDCRYRGGYRCGVDLSSKPDQSYVYTPEIEAMNDAFLKQLRKDIEINEQKQRLQSNYF